MKILKRFNSRFAIDVSTRLEQNYYTISNSDQVLVTGFYTGTSADANAGGYWPVGEHGQFAMTTMMFVDLEELPWQQ